MAKDTRKSAETGDATAAVAASPEMSAMLDANGAGIQALVKSSEALWSGMASMGQEMMQFATSRLRENMDLSGSVMQCGDPREAFRLECDYARSATRQFLDEAHKLLGVATETSQRSWAPIEELTQESLGRLNRR